MYVHGCCVADETTCQKNSKTKGNVGVRWASALKWTFLWNLMLASLQCFGWITLFSTVLIICGTLLKSCK